MSIRWRLAFLYAMVTAALLLPVSFIAYGLHTRGQYQGIDDSLVSTAEHFADELASAPAGGHPAVERFESDVFVRFYDSRATPLDSSSAPDPALGPPEVLKRDAGPAYSRLIRLLPGGEAETNGGFATASDPTSGDRVRLYALPVGEGDMGYVLTWKSLGGLDTSSAFLRALLSAFVLGGIGAAGLGSFAVAGNVLRPVAEMTQTAGAIAASRGFSQRVEETGSDELGRLARTFNEMLDSLEEAYRSQQRFVADAAHELRAPLTAIQGNIDLLTRKPDMSPEERSEAISYVTSEARRLSRIVSELLTLARADAGQTLERRPVELDRVVLDAVTEIRPLIADHRFDWVQGGGAGLRVTRKQGRNAPRKEGRLRCCGPGRPAIRCVTPSVGCQWTLPAPQLPWGVTVSLTTSALPRVVSSFGPPRPIRPMTIARSRRNASLTVCLKPPHWRRRAAPSSCRSRE